MQDESSNNARVKSVAALVHTLTLALKINLRPTFFTLNGNEKLAVVPPLICVPSEIWGKELS